MRKALLLTALLAGSLLGANAQEATADHLTALLKPGNAVLGIQLKNAEAYTAFQMDITLPEGMTLNVAEGADASSAVTLQRQDADGTQQVHANLKDGVLKVAAFSYKDDNGTLKGNQSFVDNKGDMLLINVTCTGTYKPSQVKVENIKYVKTEGLAETELATTAVGKLGDTNGDDAVNGTDVSNVVDHILGNATLPLEKIERSKFSTGEGLNGTDVSNIVDIILNF